MDFIEIFYNPKRNFILGHPVVFGNETEFHFGKLVGFGREIMILFVP